MPNISETSVSDISLSPACSVMIIFFLEWWWEAQQAFESLWLPERRRGHDAVVVSAVSASVAGRSMCASLHSICRHHGSARRDDKDAGQALSRRHPRASPWDTPRVQGSVPILGGNLSGMPC